ncbi:hypothetical protein HPP92_002913 [Vanilla planifolia]|uniref:BHLH domain-containing protein n=1 Tax=Vanilla planifolia TaxID=51239 RepID=A0A835VN64_VANPL|nr:hypothetical protein HPP92_002913 [Vanilla planifolia]
MSLETFASSIVYNTFSATTELDQQHPSSFFFDDGVSLERPIVGKFPPLLAPPQPPPQCGAATQGKGKRRRRPRSCKSKEEAETQRITHIAVERNRRRQMNEHLAVLRSLMPESFIQRGDQASIVGGAIDYVKELEHFLQTLEAQKRKIEQQHESIGCINESENGWISTEEETTLPPFAQFFTFPQFIWCHSSGENPRSPESRPTGVADIEVNLVETHASIRILSRRRPRQLIKILVGFQALRLTILHLSVTTLDTIALYSLSVKLEEGCKLSTVDEIAEAVHRMLSLID